MNEPTYNDVRLYILTQKYVKLKWYQFGERKKLEKQIEEIDPNFWIN